MKIAENRTLSAVLVFLAAFLVYANSITASFHWEDEYLIRDNVHIRRLVNIPVFFKPGYIDVYESGAGKRYRPLRTVSLAVDYQLWGPDPRGYHLTNVLLHAAASVAVWLFCLGVSGNAVTALFAGLLFAVHPVHAESVAWVKNRSDVLCALFFFLSAAAFAFFRRRGSGTLYAASLILALPAFLAKEMALALPPLAALVLVFFNVKEGSPPLRGWRSLLPFIALLGGYMLFRSTSLAGGVDIALPLPTRLLLVLNTVGEYLKLLIWPVNLVVDRSIPSAALASLPGLLLCAGGLALLPLLYRSGKIEGLFWLLAFLLLAAPVLNLVYIPGRPLAEQRMYLPSAAFCAFCAWLFAEAVGSARERLRRAALFCLACALVFFSVRSVLRNLDWRSEVRLWEKTVEAAPSQRSYNNYAVVLLKEKRYGEAIGNALKSLAIDPAYVDAYNTLGAAYHDLGLYSKSAGAFEQAVRFSGGKAYKSLMNLATVYSLQGREKEAMGIYLGVVKDAPWSDTAYHNLGLTLFRLGRKEDSARAFREATALNPYDSAAWLMLGRIAVERGEVKEAVRVYYSMLSVAPAAASEFLATNPALRAHIDASRASP